MLKGGGGGEGGAYKVLYSNITTAVNEMGLDLFDFLPTSYARTLSSRDKIFNRQHNQVGTSSEVLLKVTVLGSRASTRAAENGRPKSRERLDCHVSSECGKITDISEG